MRYIDFDDLWKNHLFDYKDGDLLVIDDITRLNLSDYENTALAFVMAVFFMEGRLQCVVEGQEYRLVSGDFFVYMPGQVIGEILLSQNANVKVIAFSQRAIDHSLYLHKYVWQNMEYVKEHPLFTLSERERQGLSHYYQLLMIKTQESEKQRGGNEMTGKGSFHHDVVRLLFQALMLEFQMFVDRKRSLLPSSIADDSPTHSLSDSGRDQEIHSSEKGGREANASVRQSTLVYRRFMTLLAESKGHVRNVSAFANMLNVTPKYLSKCVKDESGRLPLDLIHETTINTIRQQLRYSNMTVKEICTQLDFPNLSFFGKFVKEHLGMSPTSYRQKGLKEG